jgi:hypothetical protein
MNKKLIEEQYMIVFSSFDEDEVLKALNQLLNLGLSKEQVTAGVEEGCRILRRESEIKLIFKKNQTT